jgi:hypothetical protein
MAEKIVSPGVFTNERDLSFLPAGIAQIGGAFIGPATKGPAYVPTIVNSFTDFQVIFGKTNANYYMPYAVKEYIQNGGRATVVRTMNSDGYSLTQGIVGVYAKDGTTNNTLLFALHPSQKVTGSADYNGTNNIFETSTVSTVEAQGQLGLKLAGTVGANSTYTASLTSTSNNFITKVFPQNSTTTDEYGYLYMNFPVTASAISGTATATSFTAISGGITFANARTTTQSGAGHTYASTPWIVSQTTNGTNYELFRFHTLSEGTNANYEVKVAISNIRAAGTVPGTEYGDFTVTVRGVDQSLILGSAFDFIDSDVRPNILETYTQCNLDPTSKNYVARKIGDRYEYFDTDNARTVVSGDYANKSKYIRVEIDDRVKDGAYPTVLAPFGHAALMATLSSSFYPTGTEFPVARFKSDQLDSNNVFNKKIHYGFNYDFGTTDNLNYLKPIPNGATVASNAKFLLSNYNQDISLGNTGSISLSSTTSIEARKFVVPFQGGFDGIYPSKVLATGVDITTNNSQGYDFTTTSTNGYVEYKQAIDTIASATSVDINLLCMPGIIYTKHPAIISYAEQVAQERGDTFFVFDATPLDATVQATVDAIQDWDSNYAATYYPWVKITDANTTRPIWVPPSVVIPGVLAFNDKVGEQWFAPAGLNRGGLAVNDVYVRLNRTDIDTLYDGRVNPIATIPNIGYAVWGQKTLQAKPSALDRINVRRLMIALKKFIASASQYLVFEQNTSATRNRFLNIVNPYMESVQQRQGIYAFKVVMDDTNNTADLIDRNIMYGQIYLQPTRTAEFIIIDFNILPTGATFGA